MRAPSGLQAAGKRLWRTVNETFSFEDEPHKLEILAHACRVADIISELDEAAAEAPLTVRGSQGQPVISPFIAEARVQRALLATLVRQLDLPPTEEEAAEKAASLSRKRSRAGRQKYNHLREVK